MLSSGQVLVLLLIASTACGLQLSKNWRTTPPTPAPSRTAAPATPPTTTELQMPRDGKMDEPEPPMARPRSEGSGISRDVATTKKPQPPESNPAEAEKHVVYKLQEGNNAPCIQFQVDAILVFKYITIHNEEAEKSVYFPETIPVDGNCGSGDDADMILQWLEYKLHLYFTKTPGGDGWFVEKMELDVNTDMFEHISNPRREHLLTSDKKGLFYTPVGKSYTCEEESAVKLTDPSGKSKVSAELLLRDLRLQPFIFRNEFGPEHICNIGGVSFRDETAPIAVGSTLAIVVLCTVTGYAIFRYFKIKKVQYDTME